MNLEENTKKAEYQKQIYQKAMLSLKLPDDFVANLQQKIDTSEDSLKPHPSKMKLTPAFLCFFLCILLFTNPNVTLAIESAIKNGITYFPKDNADISDIPDVTKVWYTFSSWNRDLELPHSSSSQWQISYPDFYALLKENALTEVLLPHYQMADYRYSPGRGYIGKLEDDEAVLDGIFETDISSYSISIKKLKHSTAMSFTHRIDSHYDVTVNGITYEVIILCDDYTYNEYLTINQSENIPYTLTEDEFCEWLKRPVFIRTMLNHISYTFTLSPDINIEEFLNSIFLI